MASGENGNIVVPSLDELKYPIGRFLLDPEATPAKRSGWIAEIEALPDRLGRAVGEFEEADLERRYRPEGWTLRQVVHHLADEHLNAFGYFKMALTEDAPAIKSYREPLWAETRDARLAPVALSLDLLHALHQRWGLLLRSLPAADFARGYRHPSRGFVSLDQAVQLYAWHGNHHTAQILSLRNREGW
jgi:DinB superfamily